MYWSFNLSFSFLIELLLSFSGGWCLKVHFSPVLHGFMTSFNVSVFLVQLHLNRNPVSSFCEDTPGSVPTRDPRWQLRAFHQHWFTLYERPVPHQVGSCQPPARVTWGKGVCISGCLPAQSWSWGISFLAREPGSALQYWVVGRCLDTLQKVSAKAGVHMWCCMDIPGATGIWGELKAALVLLLGDEYASNGLSSDFHLPVLFLCHLSCGTFGAYTKGRSRLWPVLTCQNNKSLLMSSEMGRDDFSI